MLQAFIQLSLPMLDLPYHTHFRAGPFLIDSLRCASLISLHSPSIGVFVYYVLTHVSELPAPVVKDSRQSRFLSRTLASYNSYFYFSS